MPVFVGSRYVKTPAYIRNSEALVLDIRRRNNFDLNRATYYTVIKGDTLDGIAYKQYGNAQLGWAILDANPNMQSEVEIKPGDILAVPSLDEVVSVSE